MRRSRSLLCVLALIALGCSSYESAGLAEAERDIAAGTLRIKTYGLPAPWFTQYIDLMQSRLGVEVKPVAGCVVDDALTESVTGYNRRMMAEIARKFGPDAMSKVEQDAQKTGGS
jgi:hypothetical protein